MEIYRKFTKDVGIVAISEFAIKLKPLLFIPILTNALGPSDYGVYANLFATIVFFTAFSTFGLDHGLIRFLASEKNEKKVSEGFSSAALVSFLLSLLVSVIMFFLAASLANTVFGAPNRVVVIQVGVFYLPLEVLFGVIVNFFITRQKIFTLSVFRLLDTFLPISFAIYFLLSGHGLFAVILAIIFTRAVLVVVAIALILKVVGLSAPRMSVAVGYMRFGAPLIAAGLAGIILNVGDRYVIGLIMGAAAVGIYSIAYTLGNTILILLSPISVSLLAPVTRSYDAGKHDEVSKYLSYSIRYFLLLSIPASVGVSVMAPSLINSLSTEEFLNGSSGVTAVVAFSAIFYGLFSIYSYGFFLAKKLKTSAVLMFTTGAVNLLLNVVFVPKFGLFGAACATFVCFLGLFITSVFLTKNYVRVSLDPLLISKCIAASGVMGVLILYIAPGGWLRILLTTLLGVGVYFTLLLLMRAFKTNEIRLFKSFLKRRKDAPQLDYLT